MCIYVSVSRQSLSADPVRAAWVINHHSYRYRVWSPPHTGPAPRWHIIERVAHGRIMHKERLICCSSPIYQQDHNDDDTNDQPHICDNTYVLNILDNINTSDIIVEARSLQSVDAACIRGRSTCAIVFVVDNNASTSRYADRRNCVRNRSTLQRLFAEG